MKTPLSLLGALCMASPLAFAGDYLGADAVLKQAAKQSATPANAGSVSELDHDLKAFRETGGTLEPDKAAHEWLKLAEQFGTLTQGQYEESGGEPLSFQAIVAALPPPRAWNGLAKAAEAMPGGTDAETFRALSLRLTAHWLTGDRAAQEKDVAALEPMLDKVQDPMREEAKQIGLALKSALLETSDDGEAILKNLNDTLDAFAGAGGRQFSGSDNQEFKVPDLVSLVGEKKAAEFLRRALLTGGVQLSITEGDETRGLARKVALEMIANLKTPQWALTESLDATALYEAMKKRFPEKTPDSTDRAQARTYYLLGLLAAHRTEDAARIALGLKYRAESALPAEGLEALERAGFTRDLAKFFHDLLAQDPDLPFWSEYVDVAAKTGDTDKMVALAEASAARKNLTDKQRREIQGVLSDAYLAADKVEKGIDLLRKEIASGMAKQTVGAGGNSELTEPGMHLARIGAVLHREDLIGEGVNAVRSSLDAKSPRGSPDTRQDALNELATFFIENGRGVEAEGVLAQALVSVTPPQAGVPSYPSSSRRSLVLLMKVYDRANRPADVLALLDHSPQWGEKDLAGVYTESATTDNNEDYAGYFAAAALAALGRNAEARKINDAVLDSEGGYDPAFELMLKLEPDDAIARLDALFARDQFEPRPLIWKAKLLLDRGKLEEAEAAAKQAIAIDPSDGEHGRGRRMRVYSVLADIREARGDAKEAAFLRGAVTAIRHSEDADRFYDAGLITRAVNMYEEALTHFSDAYCIQSRLALRMAELGDMAAAEEHYRRAYELMPDSFGRVESHCFGCERAFAGERAQGIAEKVFTELAAKRPEKPQVHYLLGYLRFEEDRFRDALPEFRDAVKLDPEYLNAWKKLAEVGEKMRLPAAERDAIQLNILRLDPLGRHSSFEVEKVEDLRAAWTALEAAAKVRTPDPKELYPLAASASAIAKREQNPAASQRGGGYYYGMGNRGEEKSPGQMIAQHPFVEDVGALFSESRQLFHDE